MRRNPWLLFRVVQLVGNQHRARVGETLLFVFLGLSTGLLSLPDFQEHMWLCSGTPTMIPVKRKNIQDMLLSSAP